VHFKSRIEDQSDLDQGAVLIATVTTLCSVLGRLVFIVCDFVVLSTPRPGDWFNLDPAGIAMGDITQFIAVPFDLTAEGLVAGEPHKCATPASAIERAKGLWQIFGHAGAVALARTGYPEAKTTVLRRFGNVPDEPPI
jgi:hypothetical protein